jgi:hypothetical protein
MLLHAGETELDALPLDAPCDLQWTYGRTRGAPVSLPVVRRVTLEEIKPRLDKTAATASLLRELHDIQPHWLDVPHDASACDKYGGCPFRDRCNLTPQERIQSIMAQETQHSAFLSKLRAKRSGSNGAAPTEIHPAPAAVPATSGTVNPPSAPATAETAPAPKPEKKPRKPRKTKAQKAADAANAAKAAERSSSPDGMTASESAMSKSAAPAPQAPVSASTATAGTRAAPAPAKPVAPAVAPPTVPMGSVAGNVLDMLNSQFVAGFKAGFEAGRDS